MFEAIQSAFILNSFQELATEGGFKEVLSSPDFNGTVFAPNDLAFAAEGYPVPPPASAQAGPDNAANGTIKGNASSTVSSNSSLITALVGFHIVPTVKAFPLARLKDGTKLTTQQGSPLYIDLSVPGVVHVFGNVPAVDPTNFATILNFQEIKGGRVSADVT